MATIEISQMDPIGSLLGADELPVVSGGLNYKETRTQEVTYTVAHLTSSIPYSIGDIFYAASGTTLNRLSDIATGNALLSGGVNTAPSWGKIDLTTTVSGILPAANGGTGTTTGLIVTSWDGSTTPVSVTAGANITITGGVISSSASTGVTSITGTTDQVIASSPTGAVTLSLPQSINITSSPTFQSLTVNNVLKPFVISDHASSTALNIITDFPSASVDAKPIIIAAGNGNSSNGGAVTLNAGNGVGLSTLGGDITLNAGTGPIAGKIKLNTGVVNIDSLSASQLVATDASKNLVSVGTGYVSSITGTTNQVIASSSTGAVTLSLPQSISAGSSPQFSKLTINSSAADALSVKNISPPSGLPTDPNLVISTPGPSPTLPAASIILQTGNGNSSAGGAITLQGGNGLGAGTNPGGAINITCGSGLGPLGVGGALNLTSGSSSGSAAGAMTFTGGSSVNSSGAPVNITAGSGGSAGGDVSLTVGTGPTPGKIVLNSATIQLDSIPVSTSIEIKTPTPSSTVNAQAINIRPANGVSSNGGALNLNAGSGNGSGSQVGGPVTISSGSTTSSTGNAGSISINSGNSSNANGGNIVLTAGNGAVEGGNITLNAGTGSTSGSINLKTGFVKVDSLSPSQFVTTDANRNLISMLLSAIGLVNVRKFDTAGTYTPTAGVTKAIIIATAAGGGGGGSGSAVLAGGNGGLGGQTTFGSGGSLFILNGGAGGIGASANEGRGGAGGSGGTGSLVLDLSGGGGCSGVQGSGGNGAPSFWGGGGRGGAPFTIGAGENAGGRGSGGGGGSRVMVSGAGGGGGAGETGIYFFTPTSSQLFTIGVGGSAGSAGTSGATGGTGSGGTILIFEFT